jgi:hypothetical protein
MAKFADHKHGRSANDAGNQPQDEPIVHDPIRSRMVLSNVTNNDIVITQNRNKLKYDQNAHYQ